MASAVVALRSGDPEVVANVREVARWWEADLVVRPPGAPPPPAHVHVDSVREGSAAQPRWPMRGTIAVVRAPGDESHAIALPDGIGELADAVGRALSTRGGRRVGVVGACGGAGASVVAAMLARTAAAHRVVTLLDLAGGLDSLLGIEDEPGPRWGDLRVEHAPYAGERLRAALPTWHGVALLAGDARGLPAATLATHVGDVVGACSELTVCDLGRSPGLSCEDMVVVTTPEPGAVARAVVLVQRLGTATREATAARVHLAVRGLPGVRIAAQDVARVCGVSEAIELPHMRRLPGDLARGVAPGDRPRAHLTRAVARLAYRLGAGAKP